MTTICQAEVRAIFVAKTVRTFCYRFLGIALPVYLSELGLTAAGLGVAVTLTLAGSALLTWLVRRPAERYGGRPALIALGALSALAAVILLSSRDPRLVVLAAMLGNVAVGTGETGPFLALEQVRIARAVAAGQRTAALSIYNLLGYAAAALGAATVGALAGYRPLFVVFLATMVVSHLVSNVVLILIAWAPTAAVAIALLCLRHLLSQMDVPTRQAYVMALVEDHEREAAATTTNIARTVAQAVTPALTGWVMQAVALAAPFVAGGALKIVYDLLLYWTFRDVKLKLDA